MLEAIILVTILLKFLNLLCGRYEKNGNVQFRFVVKS